MNIESYAKLYAVIRLIFGFSILFGLLGFVVAFVAQFEKTFSKYRKAGIVLIFNAIFWDFLTFFIYTKLYDSVRNELITLLKDPNTRIHQQDYTFGKLTLDQLKKELIKITDRNPGHSGYRACMNLIVSNKKIKTFNIRICKDTQRDNDYWIFTDKYSFIEDEIGCSSLISKSEEISKHLVKDLDRILQL